MELPILLFLLFFNGILFSKSEDECPEYCACFHHQVNCSSRELYEVPFIPLQSFTTLIVAQNNISNIGHLAYPHLTQLYLNNNTITNIEPDAFKKLQKITVLNLEHNAISDLGSGTFFFNKRLITLHLGHNKILEIRASTFAGLESLRELYLDYNNISTIEVNAFQATPLLRKLILNGNKQLRIPESGPIIISKSLRWLEMENCNIYTFSHDSFQSMNNLIYLKLRNNGLQKESLIALRLIPTLRSLHLEYNSITYIHHEMFSEIALQTLFLRGNPLYLPRDQVFLNSPSLSTLDISMCEIKKLHENFLRQCTNLKVFKANQNKISIFKCNTNIDTLETLDLSDNLLTFIDNNTFCAFENLQHLALSRNNISVIHPEAFERNKKLMSLDLQQNSLHVPNDGTALIKSHSLSVLDISFCNIVELQNYTLDIKNITKLDLAYNKLKSINLKQFKRLTYVDISGNRINEFRGEDVAALTSLRYLNILNNRLNCTKLKETWFWCLKTIPEIHSNCDYFLKFNATSSKKCKMFSSRTMVISHVEDNNSVDNTTDLVETETVKGGFKDYEYDGDEISRYSDSLNKSNENISFTIQHAGAGFPIVTDSSLFSIIYISACAVLLILVVFLITITVDCYRSHHRQDVLIRKASRKSGIKYDAVPDEIDGSKKAKCIPNHKLQPGNFRRHQRRKSNQNENRQRDSIASSTRLAAEHPRYMSAARIDDDITEPINYPPHNLWTQQFRDSQTSVEQPKYVKTTNVWPIMPENRSPTPPFPKTLPDDL